MSPRADGTFYNSWDMAQDHGQPWLSATGGHWKLYAAKGRVWRAREDDPRPDFGEKRGQAKHFKTFSEAAAWAEGHAGITGWRRDRWGGYHPSETDHDMACDGLSPKACSNKRKPGETLCGVHLGVKRRDAERHARWERRQQEHDRDDQLSADCRAAADPLGIPVGKGRHVQMHAEDFLALCRELTELREMREML